MEVKFRQKGIGWCTVYTWANLLNECAVLRFTEDERFKGCTDKEENELFETFRNDCRLKDIAYINPAFGRLSIELIWSILTFPDDIKTYEEQLTIYTLSVRLIESLWHHVGIVNYQNELYYLDPLRENWLKIESKEHLQNQFLDCCEIKRPVMLENEQFASFNGTYLQYPFLQSQLA